MADLSRRPLERDELAFIVGSLFIDSISAGMKRRRPPISVGSLFRLIRLARRDRLPDADRVVSTSGLTREEIERNFIGRFDTSRKQESRRYAVGMALLSSRTMASGIVGANLIVLKARSQAGNGGYGRLSSRWKTVSAGVGRRAGTRDALSVQETRLSPTDWGVVEHELSLDPADLEGAVDPSASDATARVTGEDRNDGPISLLEPWESDDANQDWLDDIPTEPGLEEIPVPAFLIDDELAEAPGAPGNARRSARAAIMEEDPTKLRAVKWLEGLGHDNSGVRIEPYAPDLIGPLQPQQLETILAHSKAGSDLRAVEALETALEGIDGGFGAGLYLRRLSSVLHCIRDGYELPRKRIARAYEPAHGSIFYLAHMRDPFETNGYVSRTHLVLTSIAAGGLRPTAITRLGFPRDLARHRTRDIPEFEMVDDIPTLALHDPGDGQIGRPVDEYIDAYADRVIELAHKYRPAAIHAASNFMNGLAAIRAARMLGIPSIYEVRGIWEITQASADAAYENTLRYSLQRRLENLAVRSADRVITISEPLKRFVIDHGARAPGVSVVPNGVDASKLRPVGRDQKVMKRWRIKPGEVVIGYIGSIVHYEGLDYVIHALGLLRDRGVGGFKCLIVGDGRALAGLKTLAERLKVADLCVFTGKVDRSEVESLYSVIDIVPLPRRSLPVTELVPPLKPFEAMAAGKTVIVSSVEAIALTVIDGETGFVVPSDNVEELAGALGKLIENPSVRKEIGSRSRKWVEEERSVDSLARRLREIYASVGVEAAGP